MNIEYLNTISVKDYNKLKESVGWKVTEKKQAQAAIKKSFLVVAQFNDKVIGMSRLIWDGGTIALIIDVVVLPEFQNCKVGKTMIGMILKYIESKIRKDQHVIVNIMAAKDKEWFYEKFGFIIRPNNEQGAGMSKLLIFDKR